MGFVMQGMETCTARAARAPADRAGLAQALAAYTFGVGIADVCGAARGKSRVALARQVAMYLCHRVFQLDANGLAAAFCRNHATARHALRQIATLRADPEFDRTVVYLEAMLRQAAGDAT
jgi:chromosomal replication initiation ATPase DnaA